MIFRQNYKNRLLISSPSLRKYYDTMPIVNLIYHENRQWAMSDRPLGSAAICIRGNEKNPLSWGFTMVYAISS